MVVAGGLQGVAEEVISFSLCLEFMSSLSSLCPYHAMPLSWTGAMLCHTGAFSIHCAGTVFMLG